MFKTFRSLADRDANIEKFCAHLDKDISVLGKKVKEVKLNAQSAQILDPESNMDDVLALLSELHDTMSTLQEQSFEYKSYQKQFKVMKKGQNGSQYTIHFKFKQRTRNESVCD